MNLSAEVLKHQPMVEKYARENGISEYVNVLLAIIQVESGGTAEDVMQSSESLGLPPNSLDTESSIKQGCKYFASLLSSCKNQGISSEKMYGDQRVNCVCCIAYFSGGCVTKRVHSPGLRYFDLYISRIYIVNGKYVSAPAFQHDGYCNEGYSGSCFAART